MSRELSLFNLPEPYWFSLLSPSPPRTLAALAEARAHQEAVFAWVTWWRRFFRAAMLLVSVPWCITAALAIVVMLVGLVPPISFWPVTAVYFLYAASLVWLESRLDRVCIESRFAPDPVEFDLVTLGENEKHLLDAYLPRDTAASAYLSRLQRPLTRFEADALLRVARGQGISCPISLTP